MIDVHFVPSPNGHKVTIALEEMGLPYRVVAYDLLKGDHLAADYRRLNPNARLPAIVDHAPPGGGPPLVVWESGAILIYLAERTGQLLASAPRTRAQTLQWLMWQMAGLGPMHGQAHHFVRYAPEGSPYATRRYVNEAGRLLRVLDLRLSEAPYLGGDYSIADIACWPWVRAARLIGLDLADLPHASRWFDAVGNRPGVIAGVQIENAAVLAGGRVSLTPDQWSNLFGDAMLAAGGARG